MSSMVFLAGIACVLTSGAAPSVTADGIVVIPADQHTAGAPPVIK